MMNEHYPAVYTDAYGQEAVDITIEEDGRFLAMTVRDIHFRGFGFDFFYVWPVEQDPEKQQQFHLLDGLIATGSPKEPAHQRLYGYTLQWTMPLAIVKQGQTIQGTLRGIYKETPFSGATHWDLALQVEEQVFEVTGPQLIIEQALEQFQRQFPPNMYLKCCQFCAFSCGEPFGGEGYLCFRNKKEPFRAIKYQPQPRSKSQINALRNEGGVDYVQEIYLCPEFEVDPRQLEIVRRAAE